MSLTLSVVSHNETLNAEPVRELLADRIKRLQAEAKGLATEHVQALQDTLAALERMAAEIADGGEAYPVGVREIARRVAEDCEGRVQTLEAIVARGRGRLV